MTQLDSDIDRKIKELERNKQKETKLESDMERKLQSQRKKWIERYRARE